MGKNNCDCRICSRSRKFFEILDRIVLEDKEDLNFLKECFSELEHAEDDAEYWEAVAKGKWPSCKQYGPLYFQHKNIS